jgi:hypothetical protein
LASLYPKEGVLKTMLCAASLLSEKAVGNEWTALRAEVWKFSCHTSENTFLGYAAARATAFSPRYGSPAALLIL